MEDGYEIDYIDKFEGEVAKAPHLHIIAAKTKRYARIAEILMLIITATLFLVLFKQSSGKYISISWMLPLIMGITVPVGTYMFVLWFVKNLFPHLYAKYCRNWLKENCFDNDSLDDYLGKKYLMYSQIGNTTPSYDEFALGVLFYKYESVFKLAKKQLLFYCIRYSLLCVWIAFIAPTIGVTQVLAHGISLKLFLALILTTVGLFVINIALYLIDGRLLDKRINDPMETDEDIGDAEIGSGSSSIPINIEENEINIPHICTKCGNILPTGNIKCPICEFDNSQSKDKAKQELETEINLVGCGIVWGAYNKKFTLLITILDIMYKVFIGLSIAMAIGCIIAIITFIANDANVEIAFMTEMTLAVLAAVFFALSDCTSVAHKIIELKYCTAWLRTNELDGSKTTALAEYSRTKNKYKSNLSHQLDIAYYTENPENLSKRIMLHIVDAIIQVLFYVSTAVCFVYMMFKVNEFYAAVAVLICLALPDILSYLIRKHCAKTPEKWLMTEKYTYR